MLYCFAVYLGVATILYITPPFTQLNTPYPATAYLKGFTNTLGISAYQCDLGIEVILALFSSQGFEQIFAAVDPDELSDNALRIYALQDDYIHCIDPVIRFLQHKDETLAYRISDENYLPRASRFDQLEDLDWAFGTLGIRDKARHLATLFLEDMSDFIKEAIDPHFGFSRYAEKLALSATSFDELHAELESEYTFIDDILTQLLDEKIKHHHPDLVCISVPFPGNVYGALRCGAYLKSHYPGVKICMGGGYPNTELRTLSDPRVFDYIDFITLDDGEAPLQHLMAHLKQPEPIRLKRTFMRIGGEVKYFDNSTDKDIPQREVGTPDYSDLLLDSYLSVLEVANPMHRLWSDGRWNKLTLAHGCYWGKCSFCDISLDYIDRYEPVTAVLICDRIEEIITQTGNTGFHFVDEAAPPALMRDLAIEILKRKLVITWWTNIRFEKSFTADICRLLAASGCIAVSGGLEVASDRLLEKMQKGVTVSQVANVCHHFTESGIMVHAYLMYGFPTQTAQETIDALEMVRQLFEIGIIQSGFWHRFSMTAHSPVGLAPQDFGVVKVGPEKHGFADNDLLHDDPEGADHGLFSEGLRTSLFNYMHGVGFELELAEWFEHQIPPTSIPPRYIERSVEKSPPKIKGRLLWTGSMPLALAAAGGVELVFHTKADTFYLELDESMAAMVMELLEDASPKSDKKVMLDGLSTEFLESTAFYVLKDKALLVV